VNRKADFFYKTNRFESVRITNRIDLNRELECSSVRREEERQCGGQLELAVNMAPSGHVIATTGS